MGVNINKYPFDIMLKDGSRGFLKRRTYDGAIVEINGQEQFVLNGEFDEMKRPKVLPPPPPPKRIIK